MGESAGLASVHAHDADERSAGRTSRAVGASFGELGGGSAASDRGLIELVTIAEDTVKERRRRGQTMSVL